MRISLSIPLTLEEIAVTDIDSDGKITINDALHLAHEAKFEGGAASGYSSAMGDYGLAIEKLWGESNGSGYSYYVNNAPAMSLTDEVKNGDFVHAFVYADKVNFSDTYSFFETSVLTASEGESVTLTLLSSGFDENWAPKITPVSNAVITIDGKATNFKTDSEGKVTITIDSAGKHVISATSDAFVLVPPSGIVTVSETVAPPTGDHLMIYALVITLSVATLCLVKSKHEFQK